MKIFDPAEGSALPRIAVSLGDPGGVGPEIALMAAHDAEVRACCVPVFVGEKAVIERAAKATGLACDGIVYFEPPDTPHAEYAIGHVDPNNGRAAYTAVCAAIDLSLTGKTSGVCTAPLNKEAMFAAGYHFPGHTELLAYRCGNVPVRMMLMGGGVRVVLETIHVALAKVSEMLNIEHMVASLRMCHDWGCKYLRHAPMIAVCGFNPHAGEGGNFGDEEGRVITPAIERAAVEGIRAVGPLPADTVFHRQIEGEFDIVLAMYHDQGLVAVKTVGFNDGVNLTVGLPFIRTSPDHGTAFDLAGTGKANPQSMISALLTTAKMVAI